MLQATSGGLTLSLLSRSYNKYGVSSVSWDQLQAVLLNNTIVSEDPSMYSYYLHLLSVYIYIAGSSHLSHQKALTEVRIYSRHHQQP